LIYLVLDIVNNYKDICLKQVNNFELKPSIIVETRNGLHVYWLINNCSNNDFLYYQNKLITKFNSDSAIKTLERVMRVPGYYWTKDIENKYMCKVIENNNIIYDTNDIKEVLGMNVRDYTKETIVSNITTQNPSVVLNSHKEVIDYLKKQDLKEYLGIKDKHFCCIFHDDQNPSANIYKDPKTGYWWYKCFSPKCGVTRDIITITEKLLHCNTVKALKFLREKYNIVYAETDFQKEQKEILDENIRLLLDTDRLQENYPETYKRIKNTADLSKSAVFLLLNLSSRQLR
jgi:hypothetical protein